MNYYEHHLGDYLRDTAHLSMLEDGAYRRLIDAYYIREAPLPANLRDVFRLVRAQSKQDREAVETVLREFFSEGPDGWRHGRCDREIERFREKSEKARASIRSRWEKVRATPKPEAQSNNERNTVVSAAGYERNTDDIHRAPVPRHQTPDTSNQHPPTPRKREGVHGFPPGFDAFWALYPRRENKAKAAQAFARIRPDEATLAAILAGLRRQIASDQWRKDGGQFIPHATTWLNGRRWEDEGAPAASSNDPFAGAA